MTPEFERNIQITKVALGVVGLIMLGFVLF